MTQPRLSPRRRGFFLASLAALLPLGAFAVFTVTLAQDAYRAADEARLRDTARALAGAVDARLHEAVSALGILALSRLLDDPANNDAFEARARSVAGMLGGGIVLIDQPPGFRMLANTRREPGAPLPAALHAEGQPDLERVFAEGRPRISDLFTGALTGREAVAVMVPVDRPGQSRRVLALSVEPHALQGVLARRDLPAGTQAAVWDGKMRLLAHSADPEGRLVGAPAPGWMAAAAAGEARTILDVPGWTGPETVYAVERLSLAPGWTVVVAERLAAQRATAWRALRWLMLGGVAFGAGIVLLVWANRRAAERDARREAEALRAGRAEVERLHGGLPAVIFLREMAADGSSRLIYRGGDLEAVLGWPAEAIARRDNFNDLTHPEDLSLGQLRMKLLRDGHISHEWRLRQPAGGWRRMQTVSRVLARRPEGGAEIVGYTTDVTARHEAEARAMTSARLASLGEMAAGLAHEVKQPLQVITLAAETAQLAAQEGDAAEVERRLDRIITQTQRTADIIDRLRRFARGADQPAALEPVNLGTVVATALDFMRSTLRDQSIAVEVEIGDPPPVVRGQALLLEQVLSNLMLNARDALASRPAGAARRIRISVAPGPEGTVQLAVADTGGGISPQIMPRLFAPFVTTKSPDKGTGLGLSICHRLVKGMGGTIAARNGAEGAVFTITLPAAAAEAVSPDPAR